MTETKAVARKKPVDEVARLIEDKTGMLAPVCRIIDEYYNPATPLAMVMRNNPTQRHPHWVIGCCAYPNHPAFPRLIRVYGLHGVIEGRAPAPDIVYEFHPGTGEKMMMCIDCAVAHVKKYKKKRRMLTLDIFEIYQGNGVVVAVRPWQLK
jgi:hypothetical protein